MVRIARIGVHTAAVCAVLAGVGLDRVGGYRPCRRRARYVDGGRSSRPDRCLPTPCGTVPAPALATCSDVTSGCCDGRRPWAARSSRRGPGRPRPRRCTTLILPAAGPARIRTEPLTLRRAPVPGLCRSDRGPSSAARRCRGASHGPDPGEGRRRSGTAPLGTRHAPARRRATFDDGPWPGPQTQRPPAILRMRVPACHLLRRRRLARLTSRAWSRPSAAAPRTWSRITPVRTRSCRCPPSSVRATSAPVPDRQRRGTSSPPNGCTLMLFELPGGGWSDRCGRDRLQPGPPARAAGLVDGCDGPWGATLVPRHACGARPCRTPDRS